MKNKLLLLPLFAAVIGCSNKGLLQEDYADNSVLTLEARSTETFLELNAEQYLLDGKTAYKEYVTEDNELDVSAIKKARPELVLLPEKYADDQSELQEESSVYVLANHSNELSKLKQEYLDIALVTDQEKLAKKNWKALTKQIKQAQQQLNGVNDGVLIYHHNGEFFAHSGSTAAKILLDVLEINLVDSHLASERKLINESYISHLAPRAIFLIDEDENNGAVDLAPLFSEQLPEKAIVIIPLENNAWNQKLLTPTTIGQALTHINTENINP